MTSDARPTAELPFKRIILDRSSPIPLYYQLAQQLEKAIEDGQVTPGTRMENELDLAAQLSLSRPTARRARRVPAGELLQRDRQVGGVQSRSQTALCGAGAGNLRGHRTSAVRLPCLCL